MTDTFSQRGERERRERQERYEREREDWQGFGRAEAGFQRLQKHESVERTFKHSVLPDSRTHITTTPPPPHPTPTTTIHTQYTCSPSPLCVGGWGVLQSVVMNGGGSQHHRAGWGDELVGAACVCVRGFPSAVPSATRTWNTVPDIPKIPPAVLGLLSFLLPSLFLAEVCRCRSSCCGRPFLLDLQHALCVCVSQ